MSKQQQKRGRGRPNKFDGQPRLERAVVKIVEEEGKLGPARERLAKGVKVQLKPGQKAEVVKIDISLPTLSQVARDNGIELKRGRPAA